MNALRRILALLLLVFGLGWFALTIVPALVLTVPLWIVTGDADRAILIAGGIVYAPWDFALDKVIP